MNFPLSTPLAFLLATLALFTAQPPLFAADNELTAQEKSDGWRLLFDGKTGAGWSISGRPIPQKNIDAGAIKTTGVGEGRNKYVVVTDESFGDFVLAMDFKVSDDCNSGVFFRVEDPEDPVQTGLEMQIFDSYPWGRDKNWKRVKKPDDAKYYATGALYAAKEPSENAMNKAGEWNHVEITAVGPRVTFVLNGKTVNEINLDEWTTVGKNPDGTENKYKRAMKDFPRTGRIGLQDHNKVGNPQTHDAWFKNLKIKPLGTSGEQGKR
jgi:hypothetical protein